MPPILFNDLVTLRERSGVGSYAAELLAHLPSDANVVRLSHTLGGRPLSRLASRSRPGTAGKGTLQLWLQRWLSLSTRLSKYSLYHEPDALPFPSVTPTVATVHDLSVTLYPGWHPAHRVERYCRELPRVLEETRGFIADSHSTKRDMELHWKVPSEKIEVVWLAPRSAFKPCSKEAIAKVQHELDLPGNYFLFLGNLEPRKNVAGLIQAHHALPRKLRDKFPLVTAGGTGWGGVATGNRHLGYLPDDKLVPLLCGATALIYPSFYEGFGLPPLEAMKCGVPVVSSHCGSLKEVIEDAAIVIDPKVPEQITEAMVRLAENKSVREELIAKGNARVSQFSWEKTAAETLQAYRRWLA